MYTQKVDVVPSFGSDIEMLSEEVIFKQVAVEDKEILIELKEKIKKVDKGRILELKLPVIEYGVMEDCCFTARSFDYDQFMESRKKYMDVDEFVNKVESLGVILVQYDYKNKIGLFRKK